MRHQSQELSFKKELGFKKGGPLRKAAAQLTGVPRPAEYSVGAGASRSTSQIFSLAMADTSKTQRSSSDKGLNHDDLSGAPALSKGPDEESSSLQVDGPHLLSKLIELVRELHEEIHNLRSEVQALRGESDLESLLSREEAAETLGVSVRTLDDMEALGDIQAVRIGNRVLYAPETLQAYIQRQAGGDRR